MLLLLFFKKGVSSNYRPISLTSCFSKIFERIVKEKMLEYLRDNRLISYQQFGFLSKCSTCTQLLDCVNDWTLSLHNRHSVDVIHFDFAKPSILLVTRNFFINYELMVSVVICYVSSPIFYRIAHS